MTQAGLSPARIRGLARPHCPRFRTRLRNANDIPRAHPLRYVAVGQEFQITVPVGGGTVLAAGVGDGGHHVAVVSVLDRIQSSSVVARSSLVH